MSIAEPQLMDNEPAGRPKRTLKRSRKVLEGLQPEKEAAEQPHDHQASAMHEGSQAQTAAMAQAAGTEQAASVSEPQPMEAEPAQRPKRTLKRSQRVLDGLEASDQRVSCLA